jgi:hypothetical protein
MTDLGIWLSDGLDVIKAIQVTFVSIFEWEYEHCIAVIFDSPNWHHNALPEFKDIFVVKP